MENKKIEILVIGAGPGGYAAAFRAADLGHEVLLVEKYDTLGGVCLNVGCIPSKALLHVAETADLIKEAHEYGLDVKKNVKVNTKKLVLWKNNILKKLTGGLAGMSVARGVKRITGTARFNNNTSVLVETSSGPVKIDFKKCIIACGSRNRELPGDKKTISKLWDSTKALEVKKIPNKLLVIGGGVIGLEMGTFFSSLGSKVTILQQGERLLPMVDKDLMQVYLKANAERFEKIIYEHGVEKIDKKGKEERFCVTFKNLKQPIVSEDKKEASKKTSDKSDKSNDVFKIYFDDIICSIGRIPNSDKLSLEKTGIQVDERGFIVTSKFLQTSVQNIYAIGDIIGNPMLAHKSTYEGRLVAEIINGQEKWRDPDRIIPSVVYTSPEIAWAGLSEMDCRQQGIKYQKGEIPWAASGKALTANAQFGKTKLLFDEKGYIIGAGIVGKNADDLISEATLAIEMNAHMEDISMMVHPHPTLSETIALATEVAEGTVTDYFVPKFRKK